MKSHKKKISNKIMEHENKLLCDLMNKAFAPKSFAPPIGESKVNSAYFEVSSGAFYEIFTPKKQ